MTHERPFPKLPLSRVVLVVIAFTALAGLAAWFGIRHESAVLPGALFVLLGVGSVIFYSRRRCPECRSRLSVRHDYIGTSRLYRLLYDCPRCQITWNTGHVLDESQSGGG